MRIGAGLFLALAACAVPARAGGAGREDALLALRRLSAVLHGSPPEARERARDPLDAAVAAILARDYERAVEIALEAQGRILGREPTTVEALAWSLRVGVAPRLFESGTKAEAEVSLECVTRAPERAPDFVEVAVRLEPNDAEPRNLFKTSSRRESLEAGGDRIRVPIPEIPSTRGTLRVVLRAKGEEAATHGIPLGFAPDLGPRIEALGAVLAGLIGTPRRDGDTASLLAEASRLREAIAGGIGHEGLDPLALFERCESLASRERPGGEAPGFRRRARFLPSGALTSYTLFVPPRAVGAPPLFPLLLVVVGSIEDEASPFEEWTGGGLAAAAVARGACVAVVPLAGPKEEPDPFGALIEEIARSAPADRRKVHLLGRGAGATVAAREAVAAPGRFASVTLLDGGVVRGKDLDALAPVPILVGGAGRGPTAPAARSLARLATGRGHVRARIREEAGYLEAGPALLEEALDRATAPPSDGR